MFLQKPGNYQISHNFCVILYHVGKQLLHPVRDNGLLIMLIPVIISLNFHCSCRPMLIALLNRRRPPQQRNLTYFLLIPSLFCV